MHKLTGFSVVLVSVILILALILGGCSSSTPSTSAPAPAKTTAAPAPASSSAAPAPAKTTAAPAPASSAAPAPATSAASGGTIKIGYVNDQSGPFAHMATFENPAVQIAIDEANAAGGLLGKKIELISRDDQLDPSICIQKADELKSAGVVGIIGAGGDNDNEALSTWAKTAHIPVSNGTSANLTMRTTNFSGYNFFSTPTGWSYANALARWTASQDSIKTVAAIATDVGANHAVLDAYWPFMKELKPSVQNIGITYTSMTEQDFTSAISATLAKKPDLLLDLCAGPSGASFIKQAQQLNTFKLTKVAGPYILEAGISSSFKTSYPEGITALDNCPFWLDTPEMSAFNAKFQASAKMYPSNASLAFYNSTISLIQAIKAANSTDPDAIVKAWEGLTVTGGATGAYTFDAYSHQGHIPMFLNTSGYDPKRFPDIAIGLNPTKYQDNCYPTQDQIMAYRNKTTPTSLISK